MIDNQIVQVKDRTDITQVVGEVVSLKKAGRNYKGLCPFHQEKTPSFMVSPELQIYKCFGCGKSGDAFNFLMEMEGLSFADALSILAKKAGIKLTKLKPTGVDIKRKELLKINEHLKKFYQYLLMEHPAGKEAKEYLKNRGILETSIETFGLGFAPKSWDFTSNYLIKKGYKIEELLELGIVVQKSGGKGYYDRFRNRIMFPLQDFRGDVVGFAGRVLLKDDEPKYMNSPDSPIFSKSTFLYGFFVTKTDIKTKREAIIVEGPLDMITPHQAGVKNIVAPMGTALTTGQLKSISKLTNNISFCFDTDTAGLEATKRAIKEAGKQNFNVKIIALDKGKDPDELVRNNPQAFIDTVNNAIPTTDFYFKTAFSNQKSNTPQGKKQISKELLPIIKAINDPVEQSDYLKRLSDRLGISEEILIEALNKTQTDSVASSTLEKNIEKEMQVETPTLEEYMLSLIFIANFDEALNALRKLSRKDFSTPERESLFIALKAYYQKYENTFDIKKFNDTLEQNLKELTSRLYLTEFSGINFPAELEKSVKLIKNKTIKRELEILSLKIKSAEEKGDDKLGERLQNQFQVLSNKLV